MPKSPRQSKTNLFVLQVLAENPMQALTISEISSALAQRYMPKQRAKRNVNIYQTTRRLRQRKAVAVTKVTNPNPLRSGQSDAYRITDLGMAVLAYLLAIARKETVATGAGAAAG